MVYLLSSVLSLAYTQYQLVYFVKLQILTLLPSFCLPYF